MRTPPSRLLPALLLVPLLAALAGCPGPEEGADAGAVRADAHSPRDAGPEPESDAGPSYPDAGAPRSDAGVPAGPDASIPIVACSQVTATAADLANYEAVVGCLRNPAEAAGAQSAAVKVFVDAVESHGGFPIRAGGEAIFVYVRRAEYDDGVTPGLRNDPLRVAGEHNGWTPAPLTAEKADFFHLRTAFTGDGSKRWGYKFVSRDGASQDVWFADPLGRRYVYDANGRLTLVVGEDAVGHLEFIPSVHATQLGNDRPVFLYVPPAYDSPASASTRYPVVYMHDGNNLFDPDAAFGSWGADAVADAEIAAGRAKEFLIVGVPNNSDRMNEYTHTADTVGGTVYPGKGAAYADFLVHDLKPVVDARYRTLADQANTGVLGSSLGGLISYYVGLQYPAVFKYVGGMSSTFGWGMPPNQTVLDLYAAATDLGTRGQAYYLDSGGNPPPTGTPCTYTLADDSGDSDNYCVTVKMKDILVGYGIDTFPDDPTADRLTPDGVDILHFWEPGAQHNEAAWNARLPMAFRLFFRP